MTGMLDGEQSASHNKPLELISLDNKHARVEDLFVFCKQALNITNFAAAGAVNRVQPGKQAGRHKQPN